MVVKTIRVITTTVDYGVAAHIGGPVDIEHKTFDVPCTKELSDWLTSYKGSHGHRTITGVEVIKEDEAPPPLSFETFKSLTGAQHAGDIRKGAANG